MIKPNWDIFKAKFSDNPQNNFEWFCYSLFCREFNKDTGIFRFRNHAGVETNPIEKEGQVIGWQAKFYTTRLSEHKDDFISSIDITKTRHSAVNKIIFYTNQEFGQDSKKTDPQYKTDIESHAKTKGIDIEWRTASYFESLFVSIDSELIAKHFFSSDKSIFTLIEEQQKHSENILIDIHTCIIFNDQSIEIDRSKDLEKIKTHSEQVLILSGDAGVGKTTLIKKFYEQLKEKTPFYIFKATEFELRNINELFTGYNFQDFLEAHKDETNKIIVIDSAEKLLDLNNTDPFKEFLSVLVQGNWKIIFTTRDNYLEDLNYQFLEIYKLAAFNINIKKLELKQLNTISDRYHFSLPKDEKLLELIENPFYLNEYLNFYKKDEEINYIDFKEKLWNKTVRKSKPAREQCFLQTAFERAKSGQFFIKPNCESQILNELKNDGILGYESPHGYFITHDIHEEWALEKIIEVEFRKKNNNKDFFQNIGNSLPMRRAFRKWVSEKLLLENSEIKNFVEDILKSNAIDYFWKDEILISVLLSDYSEKFFEIFKKELLIDNQELLKKLTFLLRIACKEVDEDFFRQLGIKNFNLFSLKYVLTKPKGQGWQSLIKFVFENLDTIGIKNIYFVLPIIHDWNNKFKEGETTRFSSLIALRHYQWSIEKDVYFSHDDTKDHLLQTILYGSSEIKNELEEIIKEILKNKWKNHRDPYYDLSKVILTKFEGINTSKILPIYILQLADLFWSFTPKDDEFYTRYRMEIEQYFDIEDDHSDYFPASSYQTPIYWLLQSSLKETIDFILEFTNKTVEYFAKSDFAKNEVEEIEVFIEKEKYIKQYISDRLWCAYRGTQVSPNVLGSMHMALEKFFLENGEHMDSKTLESWLLYLLKNSKSASISAIVVSIVLAYSEKTFNVAKILFRTKKFFLYDTKRFFLDQEQKSTLLMLKENFGFNSKNEIHEDERLKACDDKHRKWDLENLLLSYQFFRSGETSEEESEKRQKILWEILDDYYKELPNPSKKTELDKTWSLYLARMDRRKMNPVTEKTEGGLIINFNPTIEPELKEYSEQSLEKSSEPMKYTSLKLWANYKMLNDDKYKQYEQYEKNPELALKEVKEIISKLKIIKGLKPLQFQHSKEESFYLFNHSIPAEACSVLVRDYFEKLSKEENDFCMGIILDVASFSLGPNYQYQIHDGTQSAISVLPTLLEKSPKEKGNIKIILLCTLFNDYPIDMAGTGFNTFSIRAIHKLWRSNFEDAQSILIGYLFLKPRFEALREKMLKENYKKNNYYLHGNEVTIKLLKENAESVQKIITNQLLIEDAGDIEQLDLYTLRTSFKLIPLKTSNKEHKKIVKKIISAFIENLILNNKDKIDYSVKHDFLEKLAYFILSSPKKEIWDYLKPFLDKFNRSEAFADLFKEFISAEDYLNSYENFWEVWYLFKEKIVEVCKDGNGWYTDKIIQSYLFAQNPWKESATEWHTFKDENKRFFKEISREIGHCSSTLYAISKLLNDIGSSYLNDGISWLSEILKTNKGLLNAKLEINTIYYLENLIRRYAYKNREKIRKTKELKQNVLIILDFLIKKGSVIGYMLRENIL